MKPLQKLKNNAGFTLIETLVSLALFSVVLVISGGVIVSVININKKNQTVSAVVNNLNYSIDSMIRDIKTGYLYKCDYDGVMTVDGLKADTGGTYGNGKREGKCTNSLTLVSTISGVDTVVTYTFVNDVTSNGYIKKTVYKDGAANDYSITDKNSVKIDVLNFTVKTPDALDVVGGQRGQPSVFVLIKGSAGNEQIDASKFYVQTFISQRLINVTDFKD